MAPAAALETAENPSGHTVIICVHVHTEVSVPAAHTVGVYGLPAGLHVVDPIATLKSEVLTLQTHLTISGKPAALFWVTI